MHGLSRQFRNYLFLMRLDRPVGIWLLLWPTLWGLWFAAEGVPSLHVLAVFLAGVVLMRSAGCAVNDAADHDIDPAVQRTRDRPVASGRVAVGDALRLAVVLALIAFGLLTSLRNTLAILLSVPAVLLAAVYPLMKRVMPMPQAVLGLAFSWGIPMAYAAVRGSVPWAEALWLMAATGCWVIAYDTAYAMADKAEDLRIGVRSSAILFGRFDALAVGVFNLAAILLLAGFGLAQDRGAAYFGGLLAALALALQGQRRLLQDGAQAAFSVFLRSHWLGAAVFLGLWLDLTWDVL
jgi:4-hydroxybenzoate polyprenyltransferase